LLKNIARRAGPFQVIYAGKAHPQDHDGKAVIRRIYEFAAELEDDVRIVYMENCEWIWPVASAPAPTCG
jgi:glycogen phosphorylase